MFLRTRLRLDLDDGVRVINDPDIKAQKKPDVSSRVREGPAKNLLMRRQKNAQQDMKTQWSLLVFPKLMSKRACFKLGGFSRTFAEITDIKSSESDPAQGREIIPNNKLTPNYGKIKS